MVTMDEINYITGLQKFEGMSLREISKKTGRHFNTIKKYVDKEDWNDEVKPRKQRASRLDPLKPIIDEWLENDLKLPRKQHHTGVRIYKLLQDEHGELLTVGVQTVIHYVVKKKKELCKSSLDTAIKGYHPAGQAQVDFGFLNMLVAFRRGYCLITCRQLWLRYCQNARENLLTVFQDLCFITDLTLFSAIPIKVRRKVM